MILISGYFLASPNKHKGYQQYFSSAVELAKEQNKLLGIIINSEKQQVMKYGKVVVRTSVICKRLKRYFKKHFNINPIMSVSLSEDRTIVADILFLKNLYDVTLFKDGDYDEKHTVPEETVCNVIYGHNPKIDSSSRILSITTMNYNS